MSAVRAVTESQSGSAILRKFALTSVVQLPEFTDGGFFVIFGKVTLANHDGDPQDAHVQLRLGGEGGVVLDETFVRIAGSGDANRQCASVQSELKEVPTGGTVDIACGTFDGVALQAKLTVLEAL